MRCPCLLMVYHNIYLDTLLSGLMSWWLCLQLEYISHVIKASSSFSFTLIPHGISDKAIGVIFCCFMDKKQGWLDLWLYNNNISSSIFPFPVIQTIPLALMRILFSNWNFEEIVCIIAYVCWISCGLNLISSGLVLIVIEQSDSVIDRIFDSTITHLVEAWEEIRIAILLSMRGMFVFIVFVKQNICLSDPCFVAKLNYFKTSCISSTCLSIFDLSSFVTGWTESISCISSYWTSFTRLNILALNFSTARLPSSLLVPKLLCIYSIHHLTGLLYYWGSPFHWQTIHTTMNALLLSQRHLFIWWFMHACYAWITADAAMIRTEQI